MKPMEVELNKKDTSCFKELISPSYKNKTKKTLQKNWQKVFFFFSELKKEQNSSNIITFKATALNYQRSSKGKTSFITSTVLIQWKEDSFII